MKNIIIIFLISFIFSSEVKRVNFIRFKSNSNYLNVYDGNENLVKEIKSKTNLKIISQEGEIYEGNLRGVYPHKKYIVLQDFILGQSSGFKIPFNQIKEIYLGEGEKREYLKNIGISSLIFGGVAYLESYLFIPPNSKVVCVQGGCSSALNQQIRIFFFLPIGIVTGAISGFINTISYPPVAENYGIYNPPILINQNNLIIK